MYARFYKGMTAVAIAATMALGGAVPALATTSSTNGSFGVTYNLTGQGSSLAETLTFEAAAEKVTDAAAGVTTANMPLITIDNVNFDAGALNSTTSTTSKTAVITVPKTYTSVGKYYYTVTVGHNTHNAGVAYNGDTLEVEVQVTNGTDGNLVAQVAYVKDVTNANKKLSATDGIDFAFKTGDLSVSKTVQGNLGDLSKYFAFDVTFTAPAGLTYGTYTIDGGSDGSGNPATVSLTAGESTKVTVYAKSGDTVNLQDLPAGVTYTVSEHDYSADGYTSEQTATPDGSITGGDTDAAAWTNTKGQDTPDTGVFLNNAPYIAILGGVGAAAIIVINRRRHANDED
ncbi:FctA domain-containing protein [Olsenella sp. AGMB03486]|uniref:DUF7601 domain-containing protein n=1 Tax=Olsenella sp. AGMB03486 TaxID=3230364 RepID=UPI0034A01ECC